MTHLRTWDIKRKQTKIIINSSLVAIPQPLRIKTGDSRASVPVQLGRFRPSRLTRCGRGFSISTERLYSRHSLDIPAAMRPYRSHKIRFGPSDGNAADADPGVAGRVACYVC
jgi:hypothetical protein